MVCSDGESEPVIESGGWIAPSEVFYDNFEKFHPLEFPEMAITRGGLRFPWFGVYTSVQMYRVGFWRRKEWRLHIGYWDQEQNRQVTHYMQFTDGSAARNAEQIIKFTMQTVNEKYWKEKNAAR